MTCLIVYDSSLLLIRTGKTMKYGRARSVMCLEDLDVTMCPLFSLALHFFWRYDVLKETVPDFSDRNKWYRARVFTSGDGEEYNADMQYGAVKKLHKEHGVGGHVVHGARVSAAQEDARNRCACGLFCLVLFFRLTGTGMNTDGCLERFFK